MISWAQASRCYERVRALEDMNDSWSWAPGSKHYEHLKAMGDMNDSWLWTEGSRWHEQLKYVVNINYPRWWAKGSNVRIEPLKAWHDVINLEFIIYLMIIQFHYYPSLFHVLYCMTILALTFCIIHDLGAFPPSYFIVLSLNLEKILSLC